MLSGQGNRINGCIAADIYGLIPAGKHKEKFIREIIETVYRHTLTVEMAAKTMNVADLTAKELLNAVSADHLYLSSPNKVKIQKDARIKSATPKDHLARLVQIQQLSERKQLTLQHLRLMPESGIPKRVFGRWMKMEDLNDINALIDYGWIQKEDHTNCISIHPFLHEVLGIFDVPTLKKCQPFITELGNTFDTDGQEYLDLLRISRSIFKTLEVDDTELGFHLFGQVLAYLEKHLYYRCMGEVLDKMKEMLPFDDAHRRDAAVYEYRRGQIAWWYERLDVSTSHFEAGIEYLTPSDESTFKLVIEMQSRLSFCYLLALQHDKYLAYTKSVVNLREQFGAAEPLDCETERLDQRKQ